MKKSMKVLAVFGFTSAIALTTALGQGGPLITVDEFGNGNINGTPLPSFQSADPFSGIVTLTYQLPFPGVRGDVRLTEPDNTGALQTTDVIRFDGNFNLRFFSEIEPTDLPPFDPADVAQLPPPIAALQSIFIPEIGPEGSNGAFYNPSGGLPGDNTAGASYHFISDAVPAPEPNISALAALGGVLVLLQQRKSKRARLAQT